MNYSFVNALADEAMIRASSAHHHFGTVGRTNDVTTVLYVEVYVLLYLVADADFDRADLDQVIDEATALAGSGPASLPRTPATSA